MWKEHAPKGRILYTIGKCNLAVAPVLADQRVEKVWKTASMEEKSKVMRCEKGERCMHVTTPEIGAGAIDGLVRELGKAS